MFQRKMIFCEISHKKCSIQNFCRADRKFATRQRRSRMGTGVEFVDNSYSALHALIGTLRKKGSNDTFQPLITLQKWWHAKKTKYT